ncbi:MAG: hypothetical protein ACI9CE_000716 [Flavobacterium sp.]|jgi:hypothetical protein
MLTVLMCLSMAAVSEELITETLDTIGPTTHKDAPTHRATKAFDEATTLYKQNNFPAAFAAFTRLAKEGDPRSQTILALMYKFGEGTQIDTQKAFTLYKFAAEQGYAPAQFHTGKFYAKGLDSNPNLTKAEFWLNEAVKQGFSRAENSLVEVQKSQIFISRDSASKPSEKNDNLSEIKKEHLQARKTKNWDLRLPLHYYIGNEQQVPKDKSLPTNENLEKVGIYIAQIGVVTSQNSANNLWMKLSESLPELFKDLKPQISLSRESTGIIYRIRTGEYLTYIDAQNFCNILLENDGHTACLPIKQR